MPRSGAGAEWRGRLLAGSRPAVDHADSSLAHAAAAVTAAALAADRGLPAIAAAVPAGIDEDALVRELAVHRVIDLVAPHADALGFSADGTDRLRARHALLARRGLFMMAATALASRTLAGAGIEHLIVKGVTIPALAGCSPALRGGGDIDVWIDVRRLAAAEAALAAEGWRRPEGIVVPPGGSGVACSLLRWTYGQTTLSHTDRPPVDLHWRLVDDGRELGFDFATALGRAVTLPALGPTARTLAPGDALEHVAQHGRKELFAFQRQLVDVIRLAAACGDEELGRRCHASRNVRLAVATAGHLAPWLTDVYEPDPATRRLSDLAWRSCRSLRNLPSLHVRKAGLPRVRASVARQSWILRSAPSRRVFVTGMSRFLVHGALGKAYSPTRPLVRHVPALDHWYWGPRR